MLYDFLQPTPIISVGHALHACFRCHRTRSSDGQPFGSNSLSISSGTGAEIEKPLAIVVVGGLVTRPIKIIILPTIYEWVARGRGAAAPPAEETIEA